MTEFIGRILEFDGTSVNVEGTWIKCTKKSAEFIGRWVGKDAYIDINKYNQVGFSDDPGKHPGVKRFSDIPLPSKGESNPSSLPPGVYELTGKDKVILWQNQMDRAVEIITLSGIYESLTPDAIMMVVLDMTTKLMNKSLEKFETGRIVGVGED
jgi:hypothetical protein